MNSPCKPVGLTLADISSKRLGESTFRSAKKSRDEERVVLPIARKHPNLPRKFYGHSLFQNMHGDRFVRESLNPEKIAINVQHESYSSVSSSDEEDRHERPVSVQRVHRQQLNNMLKANIFGDRTSSEQKLAVVSAHRKQPSLTPYQVDCSRNFWEKERVIVRLKKLRELDEICVPGEEKESLNTALQLNELHSKSSLIFNHDFDPLYSKNLGTLRKISMSPVTALDAPGMQLEEIRPMASNQSMEWLAVGLLNKIHMLDRNQQVWELCQLDSEEEIVTCLKWLTNQHIIAGTSHGMLHVWDIEKKRRVRRIKASRDPVLALDSHLHLVACASLDHAIKIHDLRLQKSVVLTLNGHAKEVRALKFCPRGEFLASACSEGIVKLWEIKSQISGKQEPNPPHVMFHKTQFDIFEGVSPCAVNDLAWCPWNSSIIAACCSRPAGLLLLLDIDQEKQIERVETGTTINGVLFSKSTREILTCHGAPYNQMTLWKYGKKLSVVAEFFAHTGPISQVVLAGNTRVASISVDETLRHWDIFPEKKLEEHEKSLSEGKLGAAKSISLR